jgi:hypothetical protein
VKLEIAAFAFRQKDGSLVHHQSLPLPVIHDNRRAAEFDRRAQEPGTEVVEATVTIDYPDPPPAPLRWEFERDVCVKPWGQVAGLTDGNETMPWLYHAEHDFSQGERRRVRVTIEEVQP